YYTPYITAVLPAYMIFVAAAPLVLVALGRWEAGALALSGALWLIAEAIPAFKIPNLNADGVIGLNPLAWQFLFCIGLAIGKRAYRDGGTLLRIPWLYAFAWTVVALNFAFCFWLFLGPRIGMDISA